MQEFLESSEEDSIESSDVVTELYADEDLLEMLGFNPNNEAQVRIELEDMYGDRVFHYGEYSGTVSEMTACPAFQFVISKGVGAASAWLEVNDQPEEKDDGEENNISETEADQIVDDSEQSVPDEKPIAIVVAEKVKPEVKVKPESSPRVEVKEEEKLPAPDEKKGPEPDSEPSGLIIEVKKDKKIPKKMTVKEPSIPLTTTKNETSPKVIVPVTILDTPIDSSVKDEQTAYENTVDTDKKPAMDETREVLIKVEDPEEFLEVTQSTESKLENTPVVEVEETEGVEAYVEMDNTPKQKFIIEPLADETPVTSTEDAIQDQDPVLESIQKDLTLDDEEKVLSVFDKILQSEQSEPDTAELNDTVVEIDIIQPMVIEAAIDFIQEVPEIVTEVTPENIYIQAATVIKKIERLEFVKTAEECREALGELRKELRELLMRLGYEDVEVIVERVLKQYDIITLKQYIALLSQKIEESKMPKTITRHRKVKRISYDRYGSHAVRMLVNI